MLYKPNLDAVVERYRAFWDRRMGDQVMAIMDVMEADFSVLSALPDIPRYFEAVEARARFCSKINDDAVPIASMGFGSNAFAGFLGSPVGFSGGIGWAEPPLDNWDDLDKLHFDEDNYWVRKLIQMCRYFARHASGKFGLIPTETISELNFVYALRGARTYTDIYDYPDQVAEAMDLGLEINVKLLELQWEMIGGYQGGVWGRHNVWFPGRAVWLSVDAYTLCHPRVYADLGYRWTQELIDHFGGGFVHNHAIGIHLLPEVVKLKNLVGLQLGNDPGQPDVFEQLGEVKRVIGDIPLYIECSYQQFTTGLREHTLPGNTLYRVDKVPSVDEANRLMDAVRAYRV
jgi:hypothetical protein